MPTISVFFGISIRMFLKGKEHNPPHIHAFYGDEMATFHIPSGEIFQGNLPEKVKRMVKEFVSKYQNELMEMWDTGKYIKLKGLE